MMSYNSLEHKKDIRQGWFMFGLVALFYCYEYLLRIQPSAMSESLSQYYSIDSAGFGHLFAIYYYSYTLMQLPVGILLDKFGVRIALSLACLCCAIGTFLFACSHDLFIAQVGRFLVGFGAAFGFVGVLKIAIIWLPPNYFGMATGLTNTIALLGGMIGNNFMALLVNVVGWRFTTFFFAAMGLLLTYTLWRKLAKKPTLIFNNTADKQPSLTFKILFLEVALLLKKRHFWLAACVAGMLYTALSVFAELWGVPYLQTVRHLSNQESVLIISMMFLGWAVTAPLIGFYSNYIQNQYRFLFTTSLIATVCIFSILYIHSLPLWMVGILLFLLGAFSSSQIIVFGILKKLGPNNMAGTIIALTNTVIMLIGAILQPLVGTLIDLTKEGWFASYHYQISLFILPLIFLGAALLARLLSKKFYSEAEQI